MIGYKDENDKVVHIGEWDYGAEGIQTPLPANFTLCDIEVKECGDSAKVCTDNYTALRQTEYPSVIEQLDYIYHKGVEAWKEDVINPIKIKYPKT